MRRRREWYGCRGEVATARDTSNEQGPMCLSLEYESAGDAQDGTHRRFLRCPPAVSVQHLQKLLRAKYGLSQQHRIDVMYAGEPLRPDLTLADIAYIYLWRTVSI